MKELTPPIRLILTEIIKKRLVIGHIRYQDIEKDLAKRWAGYWGELVLAKYVKELPQDKYNIFHDLQFQINGTHFQIDTLLLSRNYILIIEAKNISGTLVFDNTFKQLIRKNEDGTDEAFEDPRVQCQRLQSLLRRLLIKIGYNLLPIDYLIFFKSTNTILKTNPGDRTDFSKVCKGRDVLNKIESLELRYPQEKVDNKTINKIAKLLLSQHSPKQINILEEYNLTKNDIRSGVCCPNEKCCHIPMGYKRGKWICTACHTSSKDAHLEALNDYFYIFGPTITISEFRCFLHLPTDDTAQKILFRLMLPKSGKTKGRIYHLNPMKVKTCVLS